VSCAKTVEPIKMFRLY